MLNRTLSDIKVGERAVVSGILSEDPIRRRLLDLGLIAGTEVECLGRSPGGDPSAYFIRGAVIALRREDCKNITLKA